MHHLLQVALLPVAAILVWVIGRDRLREPPRVIWTTIALGVASALPVIVVEMALSALLGMPDGPTSIAGAVVTSFVVAALVEEIFKFLVLWFYAARHQAFDEPFDGIVYGVAASLGFAAIENVMYVLPNGAGVGMLRAFTAVPMHAACGVLMGSCIGIGKFSRGTAAAWITLGVGGAVALHGVYDSFAFSSEVLSDRAETALAALCVLGLLTTTVLAAGASVLGIARMRRDQERTVLGAGIQMTSGQWRIESRLPPIHAGWSESTVSIRSVGAPALPMAALLCTVLSVAAGVLLLGLAIAYADIDEDDMPGLAAFAVLACLAISGLGSLAGATCGIVALARRDRWTAASVTALVLAAVMLGVVLLAVVAALLETVGH